MLSRITFKYCWCECDFVIDTFIPFNLQYFETSIFQILFVTCVIFITDLFLDLFSFSLMHYVSYVPFTCPVCMIDMV